MYTHVYIYKPTCTHPILYMHIHMPNPVYIYIYTYIPGVLKTAPNIPARKPPCIIYHRHDYTIAWLLSIWCVEEKSVYLLNSHYSWSSLYIIVIHFNCSRQHPTYPQGNRPGLLILIITISFYDDDCLYHHSWRNNLVIAFGTPLSLSYLPSHSHHCYPFEVLKRHQSVFLTFHDHHHTTSSLPFIWLVKTCHSFDL